MALPPWPPRAVGLGWDRKGEWVGEGTELGKSRGPVKVKRVTWVPVTLEDMDGCGSSPMSVAGSCLVSL